MEPNESKKEFMTEGLSRNTRYDLWAPIWILITFNIFLFVFGIISTHVEALFSQTQVDKMVNVQKTASLTFSYALLVPMFLYLFFKIWGNDHIRSSFLYILAVYLYGLAPYVVATILYVLPSSKAKWMVLLFAGVTSLVFITKELFIMAKAVLDSNKLYIICVIMVLLHLAFVYFLHYAML